MTRELAERFAARFTADRDRLTDFFPGARETIETLKTRGVRMALVTNGDSATQRAKIERFPPVRPSPKSAPAAVDYALAADGERAYFGRQKFVEGSTNGNR
jgi:putative hydrolase of the HAD superfamily